MTPPPLSPKAGPPPELPPALPPERWVLPEPPRPDPAGLRPRLEQLVEVRGSWGGRGGVVGGLGRGSGVILRGLGWIGGDLGRGDLKELRGRGQAAEYGEGSMGGVLGFRVGVQGGLR